MLPRRHWLKAAHKIKLNEAKESMDGDQKQEIEPGWDTVAVAAGTRCALGTVVLGPNVSPSLIVQVWPVLAGLSL